MTNTTDLFIDVNGYYALPTDVNFNTAIGELTLTSNTTGTYNTAVGYIAMVDKHHGRITRLSAAARWSKIPRERRTQPSVTGH